MDIITNLDLLTVGISVSGSVILGFAVLFSNTKKSSNRWFFVFTLVTSLWGVCNFLSYQTRDTEIALWLIRGVMFLAVWQTFSFYMFLLHFSSRDTLRYTKVFWALLFLASAAAILTLTPYVFSTVAFESFTSVAQPSPGIALPIFALAALLLLYAGLSNLMRRIPEADPEFSLQLKTLAWGAGIMFVLIVIFDLLFPIVLDNTGLISLSSLFILPFIGAAAYAILREHLFNIKIFATAVLIFFLSVVSFGEVIFSNSLTLVLLRISIFAIVLAVGISLIRSVTHEVEQRERIEKLATELQETNERQETLIHFIGHEVKGFLTKDTDALAALVDGDFGALPDVLKPFVEHALAESRQGADSVASILKASNLKKGIVSYTMETFDFKTLAEEAIEKARPAAEQKGLVLSFSADEAGAPYTCSGDKEEIRDHVLRNLIDNAVNYTPSGAITVTLSKGKGTIVVSIKDTGVGITNEDKKRLFTEGGHGKDSQRVNVQSTGYGLYVAKSVIEAHRGSIQAESEGAGKGSTFIAEFPV